MKTALSCRSSRNSCPPTSMHRNLFMGGKVPMNLSGIMILVCLLAWSGTACASEAAYEQAFSRGMAALEDGNYGGAVTEYRAALTERPDDAEATLYLGI